MKRSFKFILLITVFLVVSSFVLFVLGVRPGVKTATITIKDKTLKVAVADMPYSGKMGLMWRVYLPEDQGMIFICPEGKNISFWMKNTFLPLSIAFVDKNNTILSIQKMTPLDTTKIYTSPDPYKYAIETNQGWFKANNIKEGDSIFLFRTRR